MEEEEQEPVRGARRRALAVGGRPARRSRGSMMKFALVNPNWTFEGSTYFGCRDPHYPLELLFAADQIIAAGHEPLVIDAQVDDLTIEQVRQELRGLRPDFLVIPTAPSYLFWRCPQPELRVPMR